MFVGNGVARNHLVNLRTRGGLAVGIGNAAALQLGDESVDDIGVVDIHAVVDEAVEVDSLFFVEVRACGRNILRILGIVVGLQEQHIGKFVGNSVFLRFRDGNAVGLFAVGGIDLNGQVSGGVASSSAAAARTAADGGATCYGIAVSCGNISALRGCGAVAALFRGGLGISALLGRGGNFRTVGFAHRVPQVCHSGGILFLRRTQFGIVGYVLRCLLLLQVDVVIVRLFGVLVGFAFPHIAARGSGNHIAENGKRIVPRTLFLLAAIESHLLLPLLAHNLRVNAQYVRHETAVYLPRLGVDTIGLGVGFLLLLEIPLGCFVGRAIGIDKAIHATLGACGGLGVVRCRGNLIAVGRLAHLVAVRGNG